jgi:hypothetical protein
MQLFSLQPYVVCSTYEYPFGREMISLREHLALAHKKFDLCKEETYHNHPA